jgi:tetrahydromethanopterin S-methyltransferase subunit F
VSRDHALGVLLADRYAGQGNAGLLVAAAMGLAVGLVGALVGMLPRRK